MMIQAQLKDRILKMVGKFEGSANGTINAWDEQYLSVGTLQYAVKGGSGVKFLTRIYQLDGAGYLACLGEEFTAATKAGPDALRTFCRNRVWKQAVRWQRCFTRLSKMAAYAQADEECAVSYFQMGEKIAERYHLTSERGLAFAVDRCVQQGGAVRSEVEKAYRALDLPVPEFIIMKALSNAYAESANPRYTEVVRQRALTVALGRSTGTSEHDQGTGYPGDIDLMRDYGIRPDAAWDV